MCVDLLRYGYQTQWQRFQDSAETVTVRWIPCQPGAQLFPAPTAIGSSVWLSKECPQATVGEVRAAKKTRFDERFGDIFPGTCYTGTLQQHAQGLHLADLGGGCAPTPACC